MTKRTLKSNFILITVSSTLLISCSLNATYNNRPSDKEDAEKVTNKFYNLMKNEQFKETYGLFSKKFIEITDTSKLYNIFRANLEKLGRIDSIHLDQWRTQVVTGTNPFGQYILAYTVFRTKYVSKETIGLTKENNLIKIGAYNVNSEGFVAPETK